MPLASTDSAMIVTRLWATERNPPSTAAERHVTVDRADLDLAVDQQRQDRRVAAQDADVAVDGAGDDHRRLARPDLAVGRDELDLQLVVSHQRLFWISAHLRSTSSRPPHMKNACSATWSYSPSAILLNASMVSVTGTVEPSMPVNCLAT